MSLTSERLYKTDWKKDTEEEPKTPKDIHTTCTYTLTNTHKIQLAQTQLIQLQVMVLAS